MVFSNHWFAAKTTSKPFNTSPAGDVLKGLLVVFAANQWFENTMITALIGLSVFLGHLYSTFLKFKGGKGVATGLGVLCFTMPLSTLCSAGVFAVCLKISGYVSLSSVLAAITLPLFGIFFKMPFPYIYLSTIIALFILQRHHDNIVRLTQGTEANFFKNRIWQSQQRKYNQWLENANIPQKLKERGSNSVVECNLAKVEVEGSNPFSRSIFFLQFYLYRGTVAKW